MQLNYMLRHKNKLWSLSNGHCSEAQGHIVYYFFKNFVLIEHYREHSCILLVRQIQQNYIECLFGMDARFLTTVQVVHI